MDIDEDGSPQQPGSGGAAGQQDKKTPPSRAQKTPLQKEVLEASYQINPNPNEDHRRALGQRIQLDEKQVSAWFINRRRKDKRAEENKAVALAVQQNMAAGVYASGPASSSVAPTSPQATPQPAPQHPPKAPQPPSVSPAPEARPSMPAQSMPSQTPEDSGEPEEPKPVLHPHHVGVMSAPARTSPQQPPPLTETEVAEYQQLVEMAKGKLLQPYRPDGPLLGAVYDDVPHGSESVKQMRKRVALDNFMADTDTMGGYHAPAPGVAAQSMLPSGSLAKPTYQKPKMDRWERERMRAEEERMRELERAERERRKVTDKLGKERAKEEQRKMREMEKQRQAAEKEARKIEMAKDKERRAEEKKKEKEEKKREKDLARALERQGRALTRVRQHTTAGPPDDEDVEWEQLLEAQRAAAGYTAEETTAATGAGPMEGVDTASPAPAAPPRPALPPPERPVFPPPSLNLQPAFDAPLEESSLGADVLMVAGFLHTFSDLLGLRPVPTTDELAQALFDGSESLVLAAVHTALLRLLQADMEDAHASGATASIGGPGTLVDRSMVMSAHQLEAAWSWGYDIDVWRAHLNVLTWPEVLREVAVAITLAPERKAGRRPGRQGQAHNKPKIGEAGEDLYEDQTGGLKLRLPARYSVGSVKAAAWQVLAECDSQGLTITEIARRIQQAGYRDLRSSRTPEASVAGALSRDVLFVRVAPSTFALASVLQHQKRLLGAALGKEEPGEGKALVKAEGAEQAAAVGSTPTPKAEVKQEASTVKQDAAEPAANGSKPMEVDGMAAKTTPVKQEVGTATAPKQEQTQEQAGEQQQQQQPTSGGGGEDEDYSGDEDYDEEGNPVEAAAVVYSREPWVNTLAAVDYWQLSVRERMDALSWLMHTLLDGPTLRGVMDARTDDAQNTKKKLLEDAKAEKRKRQEEAAAKARAAAAEATRRLEELQAAGAAQPGGGGPGDMTGLADAQTAAKMAMEAAAVAAQRAAAGSDDVEEERIAKHRRLDAIRRVEEEKSIRWEPLGLDRRHNRYWRVSAVVTSNGTSAVPDSLQDGSTAPQTAGDPDAGRVYVESGDGVSWRLIQQPTQLEQLTKVLEPKGVREGMLSSSLLHYSGCIRAAMPSSQLAVQPHSHPPQDVLAARWSKVLEYLRPLASIALNSRESHLPPSTSTTDRPRVHKLKQDMACVLAALPPSSMLASFDRDVWLQHVADAPTPATLRRCLGQLESAIIPAYLSAAYQRNPNIHKAAWSSPMRQQQEAEGASAEAAEGHVSAIAEPLSWLPPTYSAITLRLQALDAALYYKQASKCGRDRLLGYKYIMRPGPLLRPSDNASPETTAMVPHAPAFSTAYGGVALACGQSITPSGKPRHVLLFPLLPLHLLTAPPRDLDLAGDVDQLRADVEEAASQGTLVPPPPMPLSQLIALLKGSVGGPRGQASRSDIPSDRAARIEAMKVASGAVRSAFARASQGRGGRDRDKLSKARSHKARKVRQSNLSKEWERQQSDDGDGDPDYGPDYDDGERDEDDMLVDGGGALYNTDTPAGAGNNQYALSEDQEPDFYFYGGTEQQQPASEQEEDEL